MNGHGPYGTYYERGLLYGFRASFMCMNGRGPYGNYYERGLSYGLLTSFICMNGHGPYGTYYERGGFVWITSELYMHERARPLRDLLRAGACL